MTNLTPFAERTIEALARSLEVSDARYEAADRSYKSVCEWLERPESRFADTSITVYIQGSFRLGTAIRPVDADEDYDLDIVCEFGRDKRTGTQAKLHSDLGHELEQYAISKHMSPPSSWDRCWTLNYADGAQFHMDVLPSVPDGERQRSLRKALFVAMDYVDQSISITDKSHPKFRVISEEWPSSNPNGYAEWFYQRMKVVFEEIRKSMMLAEAKADVADIPAFRVKTPLQSAIQILKHHRDRHFSKKMEVKPSSIILTTLAAHAYQQEATISGALYSILARMDQYILDRNGVHWIPNPSDPRENFADQWTSEPARRAAFYEWLAAARRDFDRTAQSADPTQLIESLAPSLGETLVKRAIQGATPKPVSAFSDIVQKRDMNFVSRAVQTILSAPHRQAPQWPGGYTGEVDIVSATAERDGFRRKSFASEEPVSPGSALRFEAKTNVVRPYKVYWQIVNTGAAATAARNLRGGFEEIVVEAGTLTKKETARYQGTHSVECFIVKDGRCAAKSGVYIVNIE